jgi:uncharacterized protein CbrC (UPF0167 family)
LTRQAVGSRSIPVGIILRRTPGVTRWAKWAWKATGILPGAGPADWQELRRDGDVVEFHVGTAPLTLWSAETEAYVAGLGEAQPCIYAILRPQSGERPFSLDVVTASPYESQDYADNGEDVVEKIPMTPGLEAWVREFVEEHHQDEAFVKRRRDKTRTDLQEDGKGDPRIRQMADVYRAPGSGRKGRLQ